jgi:endogenous inhibitor of DNA gyrase (YacG/DUF329 family)
MPEPTVYCVHCAKEVIPVRSWQKGAGIVHLRADCPRCMGFVKWLPQSEMWIEGLEPKP